MSKFKLFNSKKVHNNDRADLNMILSDKTPFAIREAFRTLYTNIIYLPIPDKCKKISISSALPGESKTYISINLAITLAQNSDSGKILLVDTDMRKPRIARLMKDTYNSTENKMGLSEYLAGITDTPNIVKSGIDKLSVMFSGAICSNPAGLINSARMAAFIKECEEEYDYIIFDTPPLNVVADATLLANKINGYLIATRSDYSNVNDISDALASLEKVGANVFGFVLSDVELKKGGRYGQYKKYTNHYYYYHTYE